MILLKAGKVNYQSVCVVCGKKNVWATSDFCSKECKMKGIKK